MGWPIDWTAPSATHLWKYNLHYFDYLHQPGLDRSRGLAMIRDWITGHTVGRRSVGWEPYPLSLRLVNWMKFLLREEDLPGDIGESLALQAHNLSSQIEYHLRGNHLWANGKTLWFAGVALADESLGALGRRIVLEELDEQFLPDGGHFELSPMYHSIVLEDLLDLINLCRFNGGNSDKAALPLLAERAGRALSWLEAVIDENGRIPLLNDSAHGIASTTAELSAYAQALDVKPRRDALPDTRLGNWRARNASGYWIVDRGPFRLIFDTASLGPDYLLGHAHCDMLQILLDCDGENIITDTGVYEYQEGERRSRSRRTSAHNTVVVDDLEQAEIWKSFRVGRRGHPRSFLRDGASLECGHSGFEIWRRGLAHVRKLTFFDDGFLLMDRLQGPDTHRYQAFFHFSPDARVEGLRSGGYEVNGKILLEPVGTEARLARSEYYPELGKVVDRSCLILSGSFVSDIEFGLRCTYCS